MRSSPDPEEAAAGEREARLMRWGLVPRWAKDLKVGYRMINAKAENLDSSRAYSPLVGKFRHRCLIVADGFYEWMKAEDPKQPRQPWRFTVDGGEPFAFAGHLHAQGVGGPRGPRLRRRLALQLHDRHHDAERARRQGPRPDAGDPAHPRGRGRLAAPRPRGRGRDRDVRPLRASPHGERPGQPEAEQGRQGDRGAGAAGRPASRAGIPAVLDGRRAGGSLRPCRRSAPPGCAVVRQIESEGRFRSSVGPAAGQPVLPRPVDRSGRSPISTTMPFTSRVAFAEHVAEFDQREIGAVRAELDQPSFRSSPVRQFFAGARVGGSAGWGLGD